MEACVGAEGICVLTEVSCSTFPSSCSLEDDWQFSSLSIVGWVQTTRLAINLQLDVETCDGIRRTWYPRLGRLEKYRVQSLHHRKGWKPLKRLFTPSFSLSPALFCSIASSRQFANSVTPLSSHYRRPCSSRFLFFHSILFLCFLPPNTFSAPSFVAGPSSYPSPQIRILSLSYILVISSISKTSRIFRTRHTSLRSRTLQYR